ncbi:MAG: DUF1697 domain-containing protein [Bacteroidia bacterium]
MQTFISILRGINVSGQKKILMPDLKLLYEEAGFKDVVTYIQSGNVIFKTKEKSVAGIGKKIEQTISKKYNFEVPVIIRNAEEMGKVIAENPFNGQKGIDMERLYVTFLSVVPVSEKINKIAGLDFSPDKFIITKNEIYLHCPVSYGNSKLSNNFFEQKLGVIATTRNWRTVNTLFEMANKK